MALTMLRVPVTVRRGEGKDRAWYFLGVNGSEQKVPRVTTVTETLDKSYALMAWNTRVVTENVRAQLLDYVDDPLFGGQRTIERRQVDQIIEAARKRPQQVKQEAADFGTALHAAFADFLNTGRRPSTPELLPAFDNFLAYLATSELEVQFVERTVYSLKHGFAGTTDVVAYQTGKRIVGDWKSSNSIYESHILQVAGYAVADEEMTGEPCNEALVIRFNKERPADPTKAFEVVRVGETAASGKHLGEAKAAFLSLLEVWRWKKGWTAAEQRNGGHRGG